MTNQVVTYNVCDRCPTETVAVETHKFSLNGHRYEVDVCEECAAALHSDVMRWADLGKQVGEPTLFDRPRKLTATTAVTELPPIVTLPEPLELQRQEVKVDDLFSQWRLTEHAKLRKLERRFTDDEVALAIVAPDEVTLCPVEGAGKRYHRRGRVTAVTNPTSKTVITLLFRDKDDYTSYLADMQSSEELATAQTS